MVTALAIALAVLLDHWLGEPSRWHPLVGFGRAATALEQRLRNPIDRAPSPRMERATGVVAWLLLVIPLTAIAAYVGGLPYVGFAAAVVTLYFCIAARSLAEHAQAVAAALDRNDLGQARAKVAMIVSRDTAALDETGVVRATCESVLENGNDGVFGAILWFVLLGPAGAVLYRLSNTLDAMWGYRNARYRDFGWASARIDDALNLLPARLCALTYALLGRTRSAFRCWATQARHWYSPNAGPVMAAGAGALEIELGGAAHYHGELKQRPPLGCGRAPRAADIARAVQLVRRGLVVWATVALIGAWLGA